MEPIKLAIVGVDRYTELLFEILLKSDRLKLIALCAAQADIIEKYKEQFENAEIAFYTDPREMLLRSNPNIVLLWQDFCGPEFSRFVLEQKNWLVLRPPVKGEMAQTNNLIKCAEKNNVGLYVWTPWLFYPGIECIADWIAEESVHFLCARAQYAFAQMELPASQELISAIYPQIFLTHQWLGIPQQIYCHHRFFPGSSADASFQFFGMINMIYPSSSAMLTLSINTGPIEEHYIISTQAKQIQARPQQAKLFDTAGNLIEESQHISYTQARKAAYAKHFEQLWQSFMEQKRVSDFELKSQISVFIAVETAKLSARTGQPESLAKVAELTTNS